MNVFTIPKMYEFIKKTYPNNSITQNGLRALVRNGQLPAVYIGRKALISTTAVEALFTKGSTENKETGKIREISER